MAFDDTPKFWTEEDDIVIVPEQEQSTDLVIPEAAPLPSIEEQETLVNESKLKDDSKNMLNSLIELNKTANLLIQIQNEETLEMQNKVIQATCTNFVQARMMNNATAENLKNKLLNNLIENIDVLDLETQAKIYNDLTEVSAIDAQQALAKVTGAPAGAGGGSGGINLTLNNITGDNAGVTQNTLAVNTQAPIQNLDTLNNLSSNLNSWKNAPKKITPIDTTGTENK